MSIQQAKFPLPDKELDSWTCKEAYDYWQNGEINLNPDYQRDNVWTEGRERDLIDSIFKNIYIPPIVVSWDEKVGCWTVIDGKQRLTSIISFIEGEIYWKDEKNNKRYYYSEPIEGLPSQAKLLGGKNKTFFNEHQFLIVRYTTITVSEEIVIFDRVQRGLTLTGGERAASVGGPWGRWINGLVKKYTDTSTENVYSWSPRISKLLRGTQFIVIAQIIIHIRDEPVHMGTESLKKLITAQTEEPSELLVKKVDKTLSRMDRLFRIEPADVGGLEYEENGKRFKTPHRVFWKPKKMAPVEMIWLGLLVRTFNVTDGQMLEIIEKLRKAVNDTYTGNVKNNGAVSSFIKKWIASFDISTLTQKYLNNGKYNPNRMIAEPSISPEPQLEQEGDGTEGDMFDKQDSESEQEQAGDETGSQEPNGVSNLERANSQLPPNVQNGGGIEMVRSINKTVLSKPGVAVSTTKKGKEKEIEASSRPRITDETTIPQIESNSNESVSGRPSTPKSVTASTSKSALKKAEPQSSRTNRSGDTSHESHKGTPTPTTGNNVVSKSSVGKNVVVLPKGIGPGSRKRPRVEDSLNGPLSVKKPKVEGEGM